MLLEYDSDRAGSFEPLRLVPKDKIVVLGLVSTKNSDMETVDDLTRRIEQASKYLPSTNSPSAPNAASAASTRKCLARMRCGESWIRSSRQQGGMELSGIKRSFHRLTIRPDATQPLLMHINPNRIPIVASRNFAQIEFNRVERIVNAAVVADIFQDAVD